jgi:hypothetical protein
MLRPTPQPVYRRTSYPVSILDFNGIIVEGRDVNENNQFEQQDLIAVVAGRVLSFYLTAYFASDRVYILI